MNKRIRKKQWTKRVNWIAKTLSVHSNEGVFLTPHRAFLVRGYEIQIEQSICESASIKIDGKFIGVK